MCHGLPCLCYFAHLGAVHVYSPEWTIYYRQGCKPLITNQYQNRTPKG